MEDRQCRREMLFLAEDLALDTPTLWLEKNKGSMCLKSITHLVDSLSHN